MRSLGVLEFSKNLIGQYGIREISSFWFRIPFGLRSHGIWLSIQLSVYQQCVMPILKFDTQYHNFQTIVHYSILYIIKIREPECTYFLYSLNQQGVTSGIHFIPLMTIQHVQNIHSFTMCIRIIPIKFKIHKLSFQM